MEGNQKQKFIKRHMWQNTDINMKNGNKYLALYTKSGKICWIYQCQSCEKL